MLLFLFYLLKVSVCIAGFYMIYTVAVAKTTFFNFNRGYLMGTLLLSFVIPIIQLPIGADIVFVGNLSTLTEINHSNYVFFEPAKSANATAILWFPVMCTLIYLLGVFVCLTRFVIGLFKSIIRLKVSSRTVIDGVSVFINEN